MGPETPQVSAAKGPRLRIRFGRSVDTDGTPPVEHRNLRIITRRRVWLFGISWGNR